MTSSCCALTTPKTPEIIHKCKQPALGDTYPESRISINFQRQSRCCKRFMTWTMDDDGVCAVESCHSKQPSFGTKLQSPTFRSRFLQRHFWQFLPWRLLETQKSWNRRQTCCQITVFRSSAQSDSWYFSSSAKRYFSLSLVSWFHCEDHSTEQTPTSNCRFGHAELCRCASLLACLTFRSTELALKLALWQALVSSSETL